jgi:hypothetical protein
VHDEVPIVLHLGPEFGPTACDATAPNGAAIIDAMEDQLAGIVQLKKCWSFYGGICAPHRLSAIYTNDQVTIALVKNKTFAVYRRETLVFSSV